jgi:hypothetical protein
MPSDIPTLTHIPSISFADDIPEAPLPTPMLSGLNGETPGAPAPATSPSDHVRDVMNSHPPAEPPSQQWQNQIDFSILLPKVSQCCDNFEMVFSPGSLFDPDNLARPPPSMPFAFPLNPTSDQALVGMLVDLPDMLTAMDSVIHVVGLPHVCGLSGNLSTSITIHTSSANNMPLLDTGANICVTLVDMGANICVMGLFEALVDVVAIPPLPISVAVHGSGDSLDDSCTHRSLLPLPLEDDSVYYQMCYFCKRIVELLSLSKPLLLAVISL